MLNERHVVGDFVVTLVGQTRNSIAAQLDKLEVKIAWRKLRNDCLSTTVYESAKIPQIMSTKFQ
jgi:hypothetical protein